jgi:Na+-transporting NADH:ubiquinone oxidoreductase subunit NqrA
MSTVIKLRKGLNIKLAGKAEKILLPEIPIAVMVSGLPISGSRGRLEVQEGDRVMAEAFCSMTSHSLRLSKYHRYQEWSGSLSAERSGC